MMLLCHRRVKVKLLHFYRNLRYFEHMKNECVTTTVDSQVIYTVTYIHVIVTLYD